MKISLDWQKIGISVLFALLFSALAQAVTKTEEARFKIEKALAQAGWKGGIEIKNIKTGEEITIRGNEMFPMASVFKLPIAIAIYKNIEAGQLRHDQKVHLRKTDILAGLRGPVAKKYPEGNVDLTIDEFLKFMVSDSDNTACDLLIKLAGGPSAITSTLRSLNIEGINVSRAEAEIIATSNEPGPNALDAATPMAMARLYERLHAGKILSPDSTAQLIKLMTKSNNPPHIPNGLPPHTVVAHKSGWCNHDLCVNDTALVTLPENKGAIVMAIFLYGKVDFEKGSATISEIARSGYEALTR